MTDAELRAIAVSAIGNRRAMQPQDVLALLDRIDAVRGLHSPYTITDVTAHECLEGNCEHEDECPTEDVVVCVECWRVVQLTSYGDDIIPPEIIHPCRTHKTLDGVDA